MHMKRLWAPLLLALLFCVPVAANAQSGLPLFDSNWHLVPDAHELDSNCPVGAPLGFGGVLQLIQNGMNATISFGIIVCVLTIMGAGILWILTPTNPENHSQAKKILTNAAIGLLIILSAWLIVDFVLKLLYDGDTSGFGPWNSILVGGDFCVIAKGETPPLFSGSITSIPGGGSDTSAGGAGGASGPAVLGNGRCSPSVITSSAAAGGYRLTQAQANTFSCLAKAESSCGANITGATTVGGQSTSAHGMFQIVLGLNDTCHNLNIPVCAAAARNAGWRGTGNLNCSRAFSGGRVKAGMEELARVCRAASSNLTCNASAAACLLQARPNFSDWTADPRSSKQRACIATYAGR